MTKSRHPYEDLPSRAYWEKAVAQNHYGDLEGLAEQIPLTREDKIATAGSCFAQHIGNRLAERGANYMDLELPPENWSYDDARRHGFGIYSCRYGNIYTVRQLLQLAEEAFEITNRPAEIWLHQGRYYDALRPSVDPVGHGSEKVVIDLRRRHLSAVKRMFSELDVFVFTLGLTEGWINQESGLVYSVVPGTLAGEYIPSIHKFRNFTYLEIADDLRAFWSIVRRHNPSARMILTVSPVPLTATASGHHVLSASTYSKSVLRAVAGDFANEVEEVAYFPSYEIVSSAPSSGWFFNPDKRTINKRGVDYVMEHFFACLDGFDELSVIGDEHDAEVICDESKLEEFGR